jgi:signal transduction histidine kinase
LSVAMRSHFEEHCKQAGIDCVSTLPEDSIELDATTQLTLFRVAQEVLESVISRGGARNVEVVIEPQEEEGGSGYLMIIGDDGAPRETDFARSLPSIRHRVELAGGRIHAEAREGAGNQIRVFVPRSAAVSA